MAVDNLAKKLSLNFPGGSLTATRGLLEAMFGDNFAGLTATPVTSQVSVTGYTRRRVIGGPSTSVGGTTYTRTKYPSASDGGAAGGESIMFNVQGDWWTARLSGSHQDLSSFLADNSGPLTEAIFWKSEKGTTYGPFPG